MNLEGRELLANNEQLKSRLKDQANKINEMFKDLADQNVYETDRLKKYLNNIKVL